MSKVGVVAAALVAAAGVVVPSQALAQDGAQRGYEQVTPAQKGGALLAVGSNLTQVGAARYRPALAVADDGDGVSSATLGTMLPTPAGGPPTALGVAQLYAFGRGPGGWSYRPTLPSDDLVFDSSGSARDQTLALGPDLQRSVAVTYHGLTPATFAAQNGQPNLALVGADSGATVITPPDPAALPFPAYNGPTFLGASRALDTVLLAAQAQLHVAPGEPPVPAAVNADADGTNSGLYAWRDGALHQVAIETDGHTPFPNAGQIAAGLPGVVSADGTRAFFTASAGATPPGAQTVPTNQLFARDLAPAPATRPVSVSRRATPDPACTLTPNPGAAATAPATFQAATPSGTVVLFTSRCALTNASTTGTSDSSPSLYAYNLATDTLTDLSIDSTDATGASVSGVVALADDASYVYFVARGKLDGTTGTAATNNLYVWHAGTVRRLATLAAAGDTGIWASTPAFAQYQRAQVSADGRRLLIVSAAQLTGYANAGIAQAYLLDGDGGAPVCLSCPPSGGAPAGAAALSLGSLSPDGTRATFTTPEALVPADANTLPDVYEVAGDRTRLLSAGTTETRPGSGRPSQGSSLVGVSPDGDDVFFTTYDELVPRDADDAPDLYDARVGAAAPAPADPGPVPPCAAALDGSCQGAPSGRPPLPAPSLAAGRNAAGPAAPAPRRGPAVSLRRPTAGALRAMARSGTLKLTVSAKGAATLRATATAKVGARRRTVARATRTLKRPGTVTLALRLSPAARATLRRHHRLAVAVAITGGARAVTATLTLEVGR